MALSSSRWSNAIQSIVAIVQTAAAITASIVAITTIDDVASIQRLIAIAGLTGVSGALLFSGLAWPRVLNAVGRSTSIALPLAFAGLGLTAGGGGLLLTLALLIGDSTQRFSSAGSAAFGFFCGVVAAWVFLLTLRVAPALSSLELDRRSGFVGAFEYLDEQLQEHVLGPTLINYEGTLFIAWVPLPTHPQETAVPDPPREHTFGHLYALFNSTSARDAVELPDVVAMFADMAKSHPVAAKDARIVVNGGVDSRDALFTLAPRVFGGVAYPVRADVRVPTRGRSEIIPFTVVRPEETSDAEIEKQRLNVLLDVSQGGMTFQIVELQLPKSGWSDPDAAAGDI